MQTEQWAYGWSVEIHQLQRLLSRCLLKKKNRNCSLSHKLEASFDDLGLKTELLHGVYEYGFRKPSPIQSSAIIPLIEGKDTIAQAESGTGKTFTFIIGTLQIIDCTVWWSPGTCSGSEEGTRCANLIHFPRHRTEYLKIKSLACVGGTIIKEGI